MPDQLPISAVLPFGTEIGAAAALVVSTIGLFDSRYVFANQAYLDLTGQAWPEISEGNLVASGAAISSSGRDKRIFMLDSRGVYADESAVIRHRSGKTLDVIISAWRFTFAGSALDLEIMRPSRLGRHEKVTAYSTNVAMKARFLPEIARGLSVRAPAARRDLLLRMLLAVSEGAILLGAMAEPHMPAARYAVRLRKSLERHIVASPPDVAGVRLDFAAYDDDEIETALLSIAGEIWALHRFSMHRETSAMLRALVEPYTSPPDTIGGGAPATSLVT